MTYLIMSEELAESLRQWAHQITAETQNALILASRVKSPASEVLRESMIRLEDAIQNEKILTP